MAKSESKRQKRLAKQKAKRNQKKHQITRIKSMGLAERFGRFESAPVLNCLITEAIDDEGMGSLLISRKAPSGEVAVAYFLIDRYCLGVKDCFGKIPAPGEYGQMLENFRQSEVRAIDAPSAKRLIEEAVAFAASFDVSPHSDFRRIFPIFNGIDSALAKETFEMGMEGQPHFIAGPYDSVAKCQQIVAKLTRHFGPDGFNYTMPISGSELGHFEEIDEYIDDEDEFEEEFDEEFEGEDDEEPRLWREET
jgi:hypothetical protein